ncbi:YueI family protein [Paenibacillus sp. BSR1-1]|uniref:YueI family protein n=1 Tax=Paenibacillus sp. BSR1-1 TaxID=3020845 RepID=UPI0025AEED1E|nr:YueI family protein [Paenibacillus sp. BSR1-1]MDN3017376.1 YueI family protein [Paenibacillus sp. BSR1-1]
MKKQTVEEVLQQGIHGPLETKPDERRKYLGTLRERIIVVLLKNQVAETKVYPQIERYMKENPRAHLFLNGSMSYENLSKYVKIATKNKIEHTIVNNKGHDTEFGLILAMNYAIDKEEILITKSVPINLPAKKKKGLLARLLKKLK